MPKKKSSEESRQPQEIAIKNGGTNWGLIIGGVAVLGVAGVIGWYFYTGYKTEQDYVQAVKDYQNCINQELDAGHTIDEAQTACAGYLQEVQQLGQKLEQGFGYWVDKALQDTAILLGVGLGLLGGAIAYRVLNNYLKNHGGGGGGGTPTDPYHDFNNNTNWAYSTDFVNHCLFDYGTPAYDNPGLSQIWTSVRAIPEWEKNMFAGFLTSQGVANADSSLLSAWNTLPQAEKIALAGLLIAGLLIICTVSLGVAVPEALPIAAAAIALV